MHTRGNALDDLGIFAIMAKALALPAPRRDASKRRTVDPAAAAFEAGSPRRGLLDRIDHWFWTRHQRELDAELGKAADIYDLEARIRAIERGSFNRSL